jgi:ParB family chromosome partitioning protein
MSNPHRRLGRGLSSLLSIPEETIETTVPQQSTQQIARETPSNDASPQKTIKIGKLRPNPYQPRQEFNPTSLQALATSISKTGLIQPIAVRIAENDTYEIIVGERRWRAAQMAGLGEIPVIIRDASREEMLELALIENIYREDINAIERANAYKRYCDEFSMSAEQVASKLGEDRSTVSNYLRLLDLPSDVKQLVIDGRLSMGHARTLLGLKLPSEIQKLAELAVKDGISVRALEKMVQDRQAARAAAIKPRVGKEDKRPLIRELEQTFIRILGTKVEIFESRRKGKGKIIIHYASLEDFDTISERLGIKENE